MENVDDLAMKLAAMKAVVTALAQDLHERDPDKAADVAAALRLMARRHARRFEGRARTEAMGHGAHALI